MPKRIIAILLSFLISFCLIPDKHVNADENEYGGKCGENVYWSLDPDTMKLTLTGYGDMESYRNTDLIPWAAYRERIRSVEIEEGITGLSSYLLFNCNMITECTIPSTVKSISSVALFRCASLKKVMILNSECWIPDAEDMFSDAVIYGYHDSTAYEYALNNCKSFVDIETGETVPVMYNNENMHNYDNGTNDNWPAPVKSYLYEYEDTLYRVSVNGMIMAASYDENHEEQSICTIEYELPVFGGFYAGADSNYVIYGCPNPEMDDSAEVFRVVRYDKNWNRLGSASLYGANTRKPFEAGLARMTEYDGMLYVHSCHLLYNGHQSNLTFAVRTSDMTVTHQYTNVDYHKNGYASHSFNQYIMTDGTYLLSCSHSDAYPRAVVMYKDDQPAGLETYFLDAQMAEVFPFQGYTGNNKTGTFLGGFEYSSTSYLTAGSSNLEDSLVNTNYGYKTKNIFVTVTPKDDFSEESTEIIWFTDYDNDAGIKVSNPYLVRINEERFLLMWTEDTVLHYCFLDGNGNKVSEEYTKENIALSDCEPLLINNKITWFVKAPKSEPVFHEIDLNDPSDLKTIAFCGYHTERTIPRCSKEGILEKVCPYCGKRITIGTFPLDESEIREQIGCEVDLMRISGSDRFKTSMKVADALKEEKGISQFRTVILASGEKFPDALAGSYLAYKKKAPILITAETFGDSKPYEEVNAYIRENLKPGGTIYILGGTASVPGAVLEGLEGYIKIRLSGADRYETNLRILEEADVRNQDVLVATGNNFADCLSASALNMPILLVGDKLTESQHAFVYKAWPKQFYILGGLSAVKTGVQMDLKIYANVKRLAGADRHETSVKIAEEFCSDADKAVLAYSFNFPDGLCAGPLASAIHGPLILTATGAEASAKNFCKANDINVGYVTGGTGLISDETVKSIFNLSPDTLIINK